MILGQLRMGARQTNYAPLVFGIIWYQISDCVPGIYIRGLPPSIRESISLGAFPPESSCRGVVYGSQLVPAETKR